MKEATVATTPILMTSPLTLFAPSPTNPRSRIPPASIAALAETIAPHGVKQPILARPRTNAAPGEPAFEIVFGERRWRACQLLEEQGRNPHGGLIPHFLEPLSDSQVLALQLLENIAREDLHPLDEATHYERMRTQPEQPASIDDIARIAKVDPARVRDRLQLLQLVPAAQEAFLAGQLFLKTAQYVASMPAHVQAEITQHLKDWGGEPMGPKNAAAFIRDRYMLRLVQAPFATADATLVPEAGACTDCGKRTGANPQLFADITDADTCTDTACFAGKRAAQRERLVDELRTTGYTVLQGDAARDACTPDGRHLKPGMHLLEDLVPANLGDASLKVVEVLQRAEAPNEHTTVVDHPSAPVVVYAVTTPRLEDALRKIKAHRAQLDKAAAKSTKSAPPKAGPTPQAGLALDSTPVPTTAAPAQQAEPAAAANPEPARQALPADAEPTDEQVEAICSFHVPPTIEGRYIGLTPAAFSAQQRRRAEAILAAGAIARQLRNDGAEGFPEQGLGALLITGLVYADRYLAWWEVAQLAGVDYPPGGKVTLPDVIEWAWALPHEDATRVALVALALQESGGDDGLERAPAAVAQALGVSLDGVEDRAERIVAERLQLGALASGKPASKRTAKKTGGAA